MIPRTLILLVSSCSQLTSFHKLQAELAHKHLRRDCGVARAKVISVSMFSGFCGSLFFLGG